MGQVRVETVALDAAGGRQIAARTRTSAVLEDRAAEVEEAIVQASAIAQQSLAQVPERDGWQVTSMEVTFGLTLAAEAGVILSKASAEASFEVTLTVERSSGRTPEPAPHSSPEPAPEPAPHSSPDRT
ncbi:CU044_2847 family protein [Streptomyces sp. NRRL F-5123]|uniref:CU044_2847 family protein n=1 Tax=Streptomyces sp. NRRL F-5123 TaxID=1463856 RepID=UPI000AAF98DC|nr:CU044_2847 family protein [Streptomyces sp. NRRL F-5123]